MAKEWAWQKLHENVYNTRQNKSNIIEIIIHDKNL